MSNKAPFALFLGNRIELVKFVSNLDVQIALSICASFQVYLTVEFPSGKTYCAQTYLELCLLFESETISEEDKLFLNLLKDCDVFDKSFNYEAEKSSLTRKEADLIYNRLIQQADDYRLQFVEPSEDYDLFTFTKPIFLS